MKETLDSSSTTDLSAAQIQTDPASVATLAKGLTARVVSATQSGVAVDMMALWPNASDPQWLIACNESGSNDVERINISTGAVEVLFTGTNSCDGVRRTPWGTVIVSEEAGGFASAPTPAVGGRVYEILDPLGMSGVSLNRSTGVFSGGIGANLAVVRPALGRLSFEGFAVYANGAWDVFPWLRLELRQPD